jgi:hypothetical protein
MAFCPNCGKQIEDRATRCASCGNEVAPAGKPAQTGGGAKFKGTMMMPGAAAADLQAKIAEAKAKTAAAEAEKAAAVEQPPAPTGADPAAGAAPAEQDLALQATVMGVSFPGMLSPAGVAAPPTAAAAPRQDETPAEPAEPAEPPHPKVTPKGTMLGIAGPGGFPGVPPAAGADAPSTPQPAALQPAEPSPQAEPPAGLFGQSMPGAPESASVPDSEQLRGVPGVSPGLLANLLQQPRGRIYLAAGGMGLLIVLVLLARLLF